MGGAKPLRQRGEMEEVERLAMEVHESGGGSKGRGGDVGVGGGKGAIEKVGVEEEKVKVAEENEQEE